MSQTIPLFSAQRPAGGVSDKRDARFIPTNLASRMLNVDLDGGAPERRRGYERCNLVTLGNVCYSFDGSDDYIAFPDDVDFQPGTIWTVEIAFRIPDRLPTADQNLIWKGTNVVNSITLSVFYRTSDARLVVQYNSTAPTLETLATATAVVADTDYLFTARRNGATLDVFLNTSTPDATAAVNAAANINTTGRLIVGARANNAAGNTPADQYFRGKLAELRQWNIARSNALVAANNARQLQPGDNTGLVHYWDFHPRGNPLIVYDHRTLITQANRIDGFVLPCGPITVSGDDVPEILETPISIPPDGGLAIQTDGIGQFYQYTPPASAEDLFDVQVSGLYQWALRFEFRPQVLTGTQTLIDWTSGVNIGFRLDLAASGLITGTHTRITGPTNETVATAVAVIVGVPYVIHFERQGATLRIRIDRMDTGALVNEQTTTMGANEAGAAVANAVLYIGQRSGNTNRFRGWAGRIHGFRRVVGARTVQGEITAARAGDAAIAIPYITEGRELIDVASDTTLTDDCTPVDPDIGDGPPPGSCVARIVPNEFADIKGIYDYRKGVGDPKQPEPMRFVLVDCGGSIFRSPHRADEACDFTEIFKGRTAGRTLLTSWCQYEDDLAILNGRDMNLLYDRGGRITKLGIEPPATAPTLAQAAGGNLNLLGIYTYIVTFYDPQTLHESDPSPEATITLTGVNNRVNLTAIPTSTDPTRSNLYRRIYRTQYAAVSGAGSVSYRIATIQDNTTTTYTDNAADSGLVPDVAIITDEFGFYVNGVPPIGRIGTVFRNRLWLVEAGSTVLRYSRADDIQAFPAFYFLDLADYGSGDPITAVKPLNDRLYAYTETSIWEVIPTDNIATFSLIRITSDIGAAGHWGVVEAEGAHFFWNAGEQRIYAFAGAGRPVDVGDPFRGTLRDFNQVAVPYASGIYYRQRKQLWWAVSTRVTVAGAAGDDRVPDNDRIVVLQLPDSETSPPGWGSHDHEVNVLAVVEAPETEQDAAFAGDYFGFVLKLDTNNNDGWGDLTGDMYGTVTGTPTTTVVQLLDEAGNPAVLPTTNDGLRGLRFTIDRAGVEYSARIRSNTADTVTLQAALGATPVAADEWRIGGIDGDFETAEVDFVAGIHDKKLFEVTFQHRLETAKVQGAASTNRIDFYAYQNGATTPSPQAAGTQYTARMDWATGAPTTRPDKRAVVWRTGVTHRLRIRGKYPDEPWRMEGAVIRVARNRTQVTATV